MQYIATSPGHAITIKGAASIEQARRIACEETGLAPWQFRITTQAEIDRNAAFRAWPILARYLATALQDLQFSEADESCEQERDERDSGTIYDCPDDVFEWAQEYCERFMAECADDISAATNAHPGDDEFESSYGMKAALSHERLGSTLYLASVGHGVTFTDDGNAPCLERMAQWARANGQESLYFGDDGKVYSI